MREIDLHERVRVVRAFRNDHGITAGDEGVVVSPALQDPRPTDIHFVAFVKREVTIPVLGYILEVIEPAP